jgi:ketohexokinase
MYREQHMAPASSYIIRSEATGTRTLVSYNDLPDMTVSEFTDAASGIDGKTWWHFEVSPTHWSCRVGQDAGSTPRVQGRIPDTTLRCMKYLRQTFPEVKISVEVERPGREGVEALAAEADVVFYSKSWAQVRCFLQPDQQQVELMILRIKGTTRLGTA